VQIQAQGVQNKALRFFFWNDLNRWTIPLETFHICWKGRERAWPTKSSQSGAVLRRFSL
jgi:hypothetical protein